MTPERYQQIGALFSEAKRLPPEERSGFLAQACGTDEALHHEVESLLGYDDQTDTFIDVPALQARFAPMPATMPDIVVSLPPVASYDVLLSLGAAA